MIYYRKAFIIVTTLSQAMQCRSDGIDSPDLNYDTTETLVSIIWWPTHFALRNLDPARNSATLRIAPTSPTPRRPSDIGSPHCGDNICEIKRTPSILRDQEKPAIPCHPPNSFEQPSPSPQTQRRSQRGSKLTAAAHKRHWRRKTTVRDPNSW